MRKWIELTEAFWLLSYANRLMKMRELMTRRCLKGADALLVGQIKREGLVAAATAHLICMICRADDSC